LSGKIVYFIKKSSNILFLSTNVLDDRTITYYLVVKLLVGKQLRSDMLLLRV